MESMNWAGYAATSNLQAPQPTVTSVSGSWVVPTVTPSSNDTFSAVWIGIGGINDQTLVQCGTDQDSVGGQPQYSAWWELLPQASRTIYSITVSPGDSVHAQIQLVNAASSLWRINLTDTTAKASFQRTVTYNSTQLSAEWIVERPLVNGNLSQLADFGNATFTNCTATIGSVTAPVNCFSSAEITMWTSPPKLTSIQLADVSTLSSDGEEFTVTYMASG